MAFMPLKPKPALIATVAAYHNYVLGKHFRSKQRQQLGSVSEGTMVDGVITAELRAGKQTHSFTVATLGPSSAQPPRHRHGSPPWRSPWPGGEQGAEPLGV